jgi:tetratricopeptide (TPR) repeat protein
LPDRYAAPVNRTPHVQHRTFRGAVFYRLSTLSSVADVLIYFRTMRSALIGLVTVFLFYGCSSFQDSVPERGAEEPAAPAEEPPTLDLTEEAYDRISLAVSLGNPEEAIAAYEQAQLNDPDAPETQVLLANLYLAAGDRDAAQTVLDEVLASDPDNGDALFAAALIAGSNGDTDAERDLLQRAVEADPEQSEARAALGEIHLENRRYDAAEREFAASLANDPDNIVALVGLGNVKLRTEEPEAAEEVLSQVIEIAPDYSFAYADRSRARAMQYELNAAEEDLSTAIDLDPEYPWHRYDRGLVRLERNAAAGAADDFSAFIQTEPEVFLAYVHRARAYVGLGDRVAAIDDFETALALRPDYLPGYRPYAMLLFEDERFPEAGEYFRRAWEEVHPNDPRDHGMAMLAALSWKFADQPQRAQRFLESAASDLPQDTLYYEMARYYLRSASARRGLDGRILGEIENEPEQALRMRMKFYLAGQYEVDERRSSAVALYREVKETELRGLPEQRLAEARYDALTTP